MVKVPSGVGFIEDFPADKFYIDFREIFNLFHLCSLSRSSLVRLWVPYLANKAKLDSMSIAVVNPYHLHERNLKDWEGVEKMKKYLADFLIDNKENNYHPVPYKMI